MSYQIKVKDKYGSRAAEYMLTLGSEGQQEELKREWFGMTDPKRTADEYIISIKDLDRIGQYDPDNDDGSIYYEEPWIFYHCLTKDVINNVLIYLKDGYWDFPKLYHDLLEKRDADTLQTICYPLYVPRMPIVERQTTFTILRTITPILFADMYNLARDQVEVYKINQTFDPEHWSWMIYQARRLAKQEGMTLEEFIAKQNE